jgi:hypothetical protein
MTAVSRTFVLVALAAVLVLPGLVAAQRGGAPLDRPAPEISGGPWIDREPLAPLALRGRAVFVEFWTTNVVPQLRAWHERDESQGLTIVGSHLPEFAWETPTERVRAAVRKLGSDRKGIVRHRHIRQGAYGETEAVITRLLAARG